MAGSKVEHTDFQKEQVEEWKTELFNFAKAAAGKNGLAFKQIGRMLAPDLIEDGFRFDIRDFINRVRPFVLLLVLGPTGFRELQ